MASLKRCAAEPYGYVESATYPVRRAFDLVTAMSGRGNLGRSDARSSDPGGSRKREG